MTQFAPRAVGPPPIVVKWLTALAAFVVIMVGVVLIVMTVRGADLASQTRDLVRAQGQFSARSDCRAAISAEFTEVRDRAAAVQRDTQIDLAQYLLGSPASTSETLMHDAQALKEANAAIAALPQLNDAVDHGYRLNGITHPACPKVTAP